MSAKTAHLVQKGSGFYARVRVPDAVRNALGKSELWEPLHASSRAQAKQKLPKDITTLLGKGEVWAGLFTWENIASWHWRMKTSKSKYRSADPSGGDARRQDYGGSDNNVRIVRQNFVRTF